MNKIIILIGVLKGYLYKWMLDFNILSVPNLRGENDVVVSLTSYGRRVESGVVYYTLVSILRQKVQPQKVILFLDEQKWNEHNLPKKLRKLKQKGVDFVFCKDVRSYTKLIPCLCSYGDKAIITMDDDVIYTNDTIELLVNAHKKVPNAICCLSALKMEIRDGFPCGYENWEDFEGENGDNSIFPLGVGSILYPPNSLHSDVSNEDLFLKLCPLADDIWFWICGLKKNTPKCKIVKSKKDFSFDVLYQYFHKGTALTHSNRFEHQNDAQFRNVLNYYHIKLTIDCEIIV